MDDRELNALANVTEQKRRVEKLIITAMVNAEKCGGNVNMAGIDMLVAMAVISSRRGMKPEHVLAEYHATAEEMVKMLWPMGFKH